MITPELTREWLCALLQGYATRLYLDGLNVWTGPSPDLTRRFALYAKVTIKGRGTVVVDAQVAQTDLELNEEDFKIRVVAPIAERICQIVREGDARVQAERQAKVAEALSQKNFADEEFSFAERRAEKEGRASARTVRDALIDVLRRIDKGEEDFADLRLCMIVVNGVDKDGERFTHWFAGGEEFNLITGIGVLHRAALLLNEE